MTTPTRCALLAAAAAAAFAAGVVAGARPVPDREPPRRRDIAVSVHVDAHKRVELNRLVETIAAAKRGMGAGL